MIGAGQTGRLLGDIVSRIKTLECVGFLDRDPATHGKIFHDLRVLGGEDMLETLAGKVEGALPVFGDLSMRLRMFQRCRALGFKLPNVIDPSVLTASDLKWGQGCFASFGARLLTGVEIGDYVCVGTGVNILHDTTIGPNCVIGGGSTIGAGVTVGKNVSFGVGVQVASGRKRIGDNAKIGAGAVILSDVPDNSFMLGNPARAIGHNASLEDSWQPP